MQGDLDEPADRIAGHAEMAPMAISAAFSS
jgi:hypothetical protein